MFIFIIIFKFKFKFFGYFFLTIGNVISNVAKPRKHNVDEQPNLTENQMANHACGQKTTSMPGKRITKYIEDTPK